VSGKVTLKDKVVKGGTVTFIAEGKGTAVGSIGEDGMYKVTDVPTGPVKICVDTRSMNPEARADKFTKYSPPKDSAAPKGFGAGPDRAELERRYVPIPVRYASEETTDLTTTVSGGSQKYDIELTP
jgi:hypothetical protein